MTKADTTLADFRRAGRAHLNSARKLIDSARTEADRNAGGTAAYLAHVALECGIKAHLLHRAGCDGVLALKRMSPPVHDALFSGKKGHDLGQLAEQLRLKQLLATEGKTFQVDDCWNRLRASERPYCLRYGAERLEVEEAGAEVQRAMELFDVVTAGLVRRRRKRTR